MKRRYFIALVGGMVAAGYPLGSQTEKASEIAIIGIVGASSPGEDLRLPAIREGLKEGGYVEGRNLVIDNRSAFGRLDQLPPIVSDLVRGKVTAIVTTGGGPSALAAKAVTTKIPIVFTVGGDPVQLGLVESLNRPGGNMTGFSLNTVEITAKALELLHEMVPHVATVALLLGTQTARSDLLKQYAGGAANAFGLKLLRFQVGSIREFEPTLARIVERGAGALIVAAEPSFLHQRAQIIELVARYRLPAIYPWREFVEEGGLMSYGTDLADEYRQVGRYAARILDGASPRDLPVQFPTRFELIINRKTADALDLTISRFLSAWANHVVE